MQHFWTSNESWRRGWFWMDFYSFHSCMHSKETLLMNWGMQFFKYVGKWRSKPFHASLKLHLQTTLLHRRLDDMYKINRFRLSCLKSVSAEKPSKLSQCETSSGHVHDVKLEAFAKGIFSLLRKWRRRDHLRYSTHYSCWMPALWCFFKI